MSAKVFNSVKQHYQLNVPHPDYEAGKPCVVRWPTDPEWCLLNKTQMSLTKQTSTGTKNEVVKIHESSKTLLDDIQINQDVVFDEAEAAHLVNRLARREMLESEKVGGNEYKIVCKVYGGVTTTHYLKCATQRQIMTYNKECVFKSNDRQTTKFNFLYEPAGPLYDNLLIRNEGYADATALDGAGNPQGIPSPVPIIHKEAVVNELLTLIQSETQGDDPES